MSDGRVDKNAATLFDIIASYHINYTYINLYQIVNSRASRNPNISKSDVYMGVLSEAVGSYRTQKGYTKNLSGLHQYFCKHTRYSNMAFREFLNKVVQEMVPVEFFKDLDSKNKHIIMATVLKNSLAKFVTNIINNNRINLFVNDRINESSIAMLKNIYMSIIITERQNVYKKFISPNMDDDSTEVSAKIYQLQKELENVKTELENKDKLIGVLRVKIEEVINAYKSMKSANDYLRERIKLMTPISRKLDPSEVSASTLNDHYNRKREDTSSYIGDRRSVSFASKEDNTVNDSPSEDIADNFGADTAADSDNESEFLSNLSDGNGDAKSLLDSITMASIFSD
jgi:hypothetical protein